jgi:hypothetical protein
LHSKLKTTGVDIVISDGFSESTVAKRNIDTKLLMKIKNIAIPKKSANLFLFSLYHESSLELINTLKTMLEP